VISERLPELPILRSVGRARADPNRVGAGIRRGSGKLGVALDVAWTLLVLIFVGTGIVVLRLLLGLARGVVGH
jgi:hypothetical protein